VNAPDTTGVVRESRGISVFTALDGLDVLYTSIAIGIVVLFGAIALGLIDQRLRIVALIAGAVALAITVVRLFDPPGADGIDVSPGVGIVVAVLGAVIVVAGQFVGGGRVPHERVARDRAPGSA